MLIWLMLVLKIPIAALLWLVWWASKAPAQQEPEPAVVDRRSLHTPPGRGPRRPRPPRRGPHAEPPPRAPTRTRVYAGGSGRRQPLR
jgi:hypothetical protein